MPARVILLPALAVCLAFAAGCASVPVAGRGDREAPEAVLERLFPVSRMQTSLQGAAEVTLWFEGRRVAAAGILVLRGPERFRIDLLDPFDRPAAVIFARDGELVQYRPMEAVAASVRPMPAVCSDPGPGAWVSALLGVNPWADRPGVYALLSRRGGRSVTMYRYGSVEGTVRFRRSAEELLPEAITWYCGEEAVLVLEMNKRRFGDERRHTETFTVSFPASRISMDVQLEDPEPDVGVPEPLLAPDVPPGTRWKRWRLVHEQAW